MYALRRWACSVVGKCGGSCLGDFVSYDATGSTTGRGHVSSTVRQYLDRAREARPTRLFESKG
jgi:hypothetical protein